MNVGSFFTDISCCLNILFKIEKKFCLIRVVKNSTKFSFHFDFKNLFFFLN